VGVWEETVAKMKASHGISTDDTDQEPATVGFPALLTKCREHSVQDGGLAGMGERRQRLPERSSRVVMNGVLRDPSLNS
jgi:hypothetical protein